MRSVADSPLLTIDELTHHFPQGPDFDCFASVGSGSEFDVSLLCQTQSIGLPCCLWIWVSTVRPLQGEPMVFVGLSVQEVEVLLPTLLGISIYVALFR